MTAFPNNRVGISRLIWTFGSAGLIMRASVKQTPNGPIITMPSALTLADAPTEYAAALADLVDLDTQYAAATTGALEALGFGSVYQFGYVPMVTVPSPQV